MRVWWTSQEDCQIIGDKLPEYFPEYLQQQYTARFGRNGRGRLWVDDRFGNIRIETSFFYTPFGRSLGEHFAGIIVEDHDLHYLTSMPGHLTDMNINRV